MKRSQLAHILRSACQITGDPNILVIGSQSILGKFSHVALPDEAWLSVEADISFFDDPEEAKADLVDGAIGEASPFHDGSAYPAELADEMGESRANISNHLACLRGCGLVRATREGRQMRYDLADRKLARALTLLGQITLTAEAGHADLDGRS